LIETETPQHLPKLTTPCCKSTVSISGFSLQPYEQWIRRPHQPSVLSVVGAGSRIFKLVHAAKPIDLIAVRSTLNQIELAFQSLAGGGVFLRI
jgi:hypothetical protein